MIEATALKNGTTFVYQGKPFQVLKYEHQKIGRGGANVKLTLRNLSNGNQDNLTLNANNKVDEIDTIKKSLRYLYKDDETATFMDKKTYEQFEIDLSVIKEQIAYVKEGQGVNVLFWDDRALSVGIPPKVSLKVTDTAPGLKGNSATNVFKPAKLENGLEVKVPLFIKNGDQVRVDTRNGSYIERVSG
ncbi:elongation factor P [Patescibacteria group bacterium]